jgi:hypothetical protein
MKSVFACSKADAPQKNKDELSTSNAQLSTFNEPPEEYSSAATRNDLARHIILAEY